MDSELTIIGIPLASIRPPATNPNRMEPDLEDKLRLGIKRYGFLQPLLVRPLTPPSGDFAYEVVDGCHRLKIAASLNYIELPCVVIDAGADVAALLQISMNRLRGTLDLLGVANSLEGLLDLGMTIDAMDVTGFSEAELRDMHNLAIGGAGADDNLLGDTLALPDAPGPRKDPGEFVLEVHFLSQDTMATVRRTLRRAGGGDIVVGLLHLLGLDGE